MKSFNTLPSDPNIKQMNEAQWVWCFLNIKQDETDEDDSWQDRLDYLGFYINDEKAKAVINLKNKRKNKTSAEDDSENNIEYSDETHVNNEFNDELKAALQGEKFYELPSPDEAGDGSLTAEEFIENIDENMKYMDELLQIENMANLDNTSEIDNMDMDDIDIIEFDEN